MISNDNRLEVLEYILIRGNGHPVPVRDVEMRFAQGSQLISALERDMFIAKTEKSGPAGKHYELTERALLYLLETV